MSLIIFDHPVNGLMIVDKKYNHKFFPKNAKFRFELHDSDKNYPEIPSEFWYASVNGYLPEETYFTVNYQTKAICYRGKEYPIGDNQLGVVSRAQDYEDWLDKQPSFSNEW